MMEWMAIYPRFDDWNIYLKDNLFAKYYCKNPKCHRMLWKQEDDFYPIPRLKSDFVLLSSMNSFLATDKFISMLTDIAPNDFLFKKLNKNVNLIEVTSTCMIHSEYVDESPLCPECKNPLSRTYGRAFKKNGLAIFQRPDNGEALFCRTKETMRDSARASYDLYINQELVNEFKKFRCFNFIKCIE
jgi:hypothetical protein